ncbi:MAG: hypothetical protein GX131_01325 [candidate division WS1 bacterium]|jgi:hypothetical protein|nr:hypothetical protein [candidate division WS1 bacterium]
MRRVAAILLCIFAICAVSVAAPEITIEARGIPAGENLIVNPGFEAGTQWPDGWGWSPNQPPSTIWRVWADEALSGARSAGVVNTATSASGYWTQDVALEPGKDYLLTCRALIEDGTILVRADGRDADGKPVKAFDRRAFDRRRASHLLAPTYWKPEWIVDMVRQPWAPVDLFFNTRGDVVPASVSVQIGCYFTAGTMYIDDVYLGPGTIELSYTVTGAPLAQVRLLDRAGELQATSGALNGAERYEGKSDGLPPGEYWCIEATATDGTVSRAWYPEAPEGIE